MPALFLLRKEIKIILCNNLIPHTPLNEFRLMFTLNFIFMLKKTPPSWYVCVSERLNAYIEDRQASNLVSSVHTHLRVDSRAFSSSGLYVA